MSDDRHAVGAYGLRLTGAGGASSLLGPAPGHWRSLHLVREVVSRDELSDAPQRVWDDGADITLAGGPDRVLLDRDGGVARFLTTQPLGDAELIHPYLVPVAALWAWWHGLSSFHGGAFVAGGGAWGVLGGRGMGKSSTLAWLSQHGHAVVADDLLVLRHGQVMAGPRCVDLRPDAADHLAFGEDIGVVGSRARWRATVGEVAAETPLRGWIHLAWGDRVDVTPLRGVARLAQLVDQRALYLPAVDQVASMDLAMLPSWRFTRPRGVDSLLALGAMVERVTAASGPPGD